MRRPDLVPDCGSCVALCCVFTSFERGPAFAFDKPAGVVCRHLRPDHRCAVHADLASRGLGGCAAYDCYGAGQRASALPPDERAAAFFRLFERHEQLWFLTEAAALLPAAHPLRRELDDEVVRIDAGGALGSIRALLLRVGDAVGGRARLRVLP